MVDTDALVRSTHRRQPTPPICLTTLLNNVHIQLWHRGWRAHETLKSRSWWSLGRAKGHLCDQRKMLHRGMACQCSCSRHAFDEDQHWQYQQWKLDRCNCTTKILRRASSSWKEALLLGTAYRAICKRIKAVCLGSPSCWQLSAAAHTTFGPAQTINLIVAPPTTLQVDSPLRARSGWRRPIMIEPER